MISKHVDADGEVTFYMDEDAEVNTLPTMDKSGTVNGKKMILHKQIFISDVIRI